MQNEIKKLPEVKPKMKSLQVFDIGQNQLEELPE